MTDSIKALNYIINTHKPNNGPVIDFRNQSNSQIKAVWLRADNEEPLDSLSELTYKECFDVFRDAYMIKTNEDNYSCPTREALWTFLNSCYFDEECPYLYLDSVLNVPDDSPEYNKISKKCKLCKLVKQQGGGIKPLVDYVDYDKAYTSLIGNNKGVSFPFEISVVLGPFHKDKNDPNGKPFLTILGMRIAIICDHLEQTGQSANKLLKSFMNQCKLQNISRGKSYEDIKVFVEPLETTLKVLLNNDLNNTVWGFFHSQLLDKEITFPYSSEINQNQPMEELPLVVTTRKRKNKTIKEKEKKIKKEEVEIKEVEVVVPAYKKKFIGNVNDPIYLPLRMITEFKHKDFGPLTVTMELLYIDERKNNYPQPPQSESNLEFFRFQTDKNGEVNEYIPGVRVCCFHVIVDISPKITPLQFLVGQFFSSPQVSSSLLDHHLRGWDAYHVIDHPSITLRTLMQEKRKIVNHPFFYKKVLFPNTTIPFLLPRDLMACLCRNECDEYRCARQEIQGEVEDEQSKGKLKPAWCLIDKPCVHNKLHEGCEEESKLLLYPDPDVGDKKRPSKDVLVMSENRKSISLPLPIAKQLDTPWGKRITFDVVDSFDVIEKLHHPYWYHAWLKDLSTTMNLRENSTPYTYQFYPEVKGDWLQTAEDLIQLEKYYTFQKSINDSCIRGISKYSVSEKNPLFLVKWEIKPEFRLLRRTNDATYGKLLYVPMPRKLIDNNKFRCVLDWMDDLIYFRYDPVFKTTTTEFGKYLESLPNKLDGSYSMKHGTWHTAYWSTLPAEDALHEFKNNQPFIDKYEKAENDCVKLRKEEEMKEKLRHNRTPKKKGVKKIRKLNKDNN